MSTKLNIECIVQIWQEGDQLIAHAMPLDVMSSGGTAAEAKKVLMKPYISSLKQHRK